MRQNSTLRGCAWRVCQRGCGLRCRRCWIERVRRGAGWAGGRGLGGG